MKKILTFAVVAVLSAVTSQAATVSWKSGDIYLPSGSGENPGNFGSTKAGSGAVAAYYFVVDAAEYGSFSAAEDFAERFTVDASTGAISLKEGVSASYNRTTTGGGAANWTNQTINEGQTLRVFAFYTYTDANKQGWYIAANPYATLATGDLTASGTYENIAGSIGTWTKTAAVPEPTTVALLALGLAAVGLKRKVA